MRSGPARPAGAGRARTGSGAGGGAVTAACRKWPWAGVRAAPAVSSVSAAGDAMEPGAAELYDQALLGILQHVGNVQDFLRVLFGFLYRKTDFYRLLRHPSDRMGFPPGAAQALVLQVARGGRRAAWRGESPAPGLGSPRVLPRPRPPRPRPRACRDSAGRGSRAADAPGSGVGGSRRGAGRPGVRLRRGPGSPPRWARGPGRGWRRSRCYRRSVRRPRSTWPRGAGL